MLSFFLGATRMGKMRTEDIRIFFDVLKITAERSDRRCLDV